ncbi:glutathione S-transferase 3-like [Phragmites australis]|uniref:glutathione S-transferase 3-like n=1 Tax=Phragmites australis TaxID=29695 RepID=UPI002D7953E3|nr:glutathione S-transferase 3-like [Phragmites australis]
MADVPILSTRVDAGGEASAKILVAHQLIIWDTDPLQLPVATAENYNRISESRAINRYIATKYKSEGPDLLPTPSAKLEVWPEVESQHFYPNVSPLVFQLLIKPLMGGAPDPIVVDKHAHQLAEVLDVYEAHLAQNKYLAGDEFTLADLNHMSYLLYLSKTPKAELVESRPHVKAWWEDISKRLAFEKTVAAIPFPSA